MILLASMNQAFNESTMTVAPTNWVWFILAVLVFLALDLGVFHRKPHAVGFREAMMWTTIWGSMSIAFAFWIAPAMVGEQWTGDHTKLFITGYVVELSLSMDNVFVIALIFSFFRVPAEFQHRVLFWGILGALVMRAVMILAGASLIHQFHWILYIFGAFLLVTGIKMLFAGDEEVEPEKNIAIRLARKFYPISTEEDFYLRELFTITAPSATAVAPNANTYVKYLQSLRYHGSTYTNRLASNTSASSRPLSLARRSGS